MAQARAPGFGAPRILRTVLPDAQSRGAGGCVRVRELAGPRAVEGARAEQQRRQRHRGCACADALLRIAWRCPPLHGAAPRHEGGDNERTNALGEEKKKFAESQHKAEIAQSEASKLKAQLTADQKRVQEELARARDEAEKNRVWLREQNAELKTQKELVAKAEKDSRVELRKAEDRVHEVQLQLSLKSKELENIERRLQEGKEELERQRRESAVELERHRRESSAAAMKVYDALESRRASEN